MSNQFWTVIIASAGLVIACLNAAWTVYRDLLDRHKVSVVATKGSILSLAPREVFRNAWDENEECIVMTATNVGRRPVTIVSFHFKIADSTKHAVVIYDSEDPRSRGFDPMPKALQEGQVARALLTVKALEGKEIEYVYVVDTVNRNWKSNDFPLRSQ